MSRADGVHASTAPFDTVVVGSGFGGAMVARQLVAAGERVLMIERGEWVTRGPHNWSPEGARELSPYYTPETPYHVRAGGHHAVMGGFYCVGGPSVFYGGVALRMRERDFEADDEIVADSGAEWPFGYDVLEPYYCDAERVLGVAGDEAGDPHAPWRSEPYPWGAPPLAPAAQVVADASRRLGLTPFRLPLAINFAERAGRSACARCATCDGFACAVSAKNDLATCLLPALVAEGLELRANTVAVRLHAEGRRVTGLACVDRKTGERSVVRASRFVLAAGALATPHLLLASGLERASPARDVVGRYLTRHINSIVFGIFPWRPNPNREFHKQVAIHDFYFGHPDGRGPRGKLGGIQQVVTPPEEFVRTALPRPLGHLLSPASPLTSGLLTIAEDQPRAENGVEVNAGAHDRFGLPHLVITHRYSARDVAASRVLEREARRVLRAAGSLWHYVYPIRTFSHATGTVRMGADRRRAPLDASGRYRGLDNLYVADGSALPTAAAVNPSLTIAAVALRVGAGLAGERHGRGASTAARHAQVARDPR